MGEHDWETRYLSLHDGEAFEVLACRWCGATVSVVDGEPTSEEDREVAECECEG